jgi:hypothetical protein
MKTVKIHVSHTGVVTLPGDDDPAVGQTTKTSGITFSIRDVPEEITVRGVLKRFDATVIVAPEKRRYTYRYDELGAGRIIAA